MADTMNLRELEDLLRKAEFALQDVINWLDDSPHDFGTDSLITRKWAERLAQADDIISDVDHEMVHTIWPQERFNIEPLRNADGTIN